MVKNIMHETYNRRVFVKAAAIAGISLGLGLHATPAFSSNKAWNGKRVGIIGLDTSHSPAFTKMLNDPNARTEFREYRVVAAYPKGSKDIEGSVKRIPAYTEEVKGMGVEIVDSIKALLPKVDVVLLETNDGRLHLEQALEVMKAGKPLFIDKPIAASLSDVLAIFDAAKEYKVPVFSSSSLRFMESTKEVEEGKIGKVLGADTFSPAIIEKTHPDLFWYGVHGVELLFTVMGLGCKTVERVHTPDTDIVVGTWQDNRLGTFRGTRSGTHDYGGTAFGVEGNLALGPYGGYELLLVEIIKFFESGKAPISPEETIEIFAFMEAADESKRQGGKSVSLESVLQKAKAEKG